MFEEYDVSMSFGWIVHSIEEVSNPTKRRLQQTDDVQADEEEFGQEEVELAYVKKITL